MIRTNLGDGWRFTEAPTPGVPEHTQLSWLPANVPGHVHLDLMRAGVIPDPFVRMQERTVAWVDDKDWIYETEFYVESLSSSDAFIVFHGLDTVAEIDLNGDRLGETDNMHRPHEFFVGDRLHIGPGRAGLNTLRVTFRSAKRVGEERRRAWNESGNDTMPGHWDHWAPRAFVRKAQYMYGWDWGPVLISCGIWKSVELVQVTSGRITDWRYETVLTSEGKALINVEAYVERAASRLHSELRLSVSLGGPEADRSDNVGGGLSQTISVPAGLGRVCVSTELTIDHPVLWQPNGLGASALYPIEICLEGDVLCDRVTGTVGIRTVELVRDPDADGKGEGFLFRVNGKDTFVKGANWIPTYSFPSVEVTGLGSVKDLVTAARDAGFNMLRIWGGGLYESEEFYNICDKLGIMVWQDFGYGCSYYPDSQQYLDGAREEAVAAVRRIRNHASLVLWCGNNENDTMFDTNWGNLSPARYLGNALYREVLPEVVATEDPGRAYWPSSPTGGPDANSDDFGDTHNWDVWHGRGDWIHYAESRARFASEFGFAASCGLAAWKSCLAEDDRSARSSVVRWHEKTRKGYDTYFSFIAAHFPVPETLPDLVYYSQINQAEALKFGIEHYRRLKGRCWGTLFWQLNDCWPVQSWSIIDSAGEPKAAYFACKKFYAPLLLSLVRRDNVVEAHLVNDNLSAESGTLTITLEAFDGRVLETVSCDAFVPENGTALIASFDLSKARDIEKLCYVYARFIAGTNTVVDNLLLLAEPKDLDLREPDLSVRADAGEQPGTVVLTLEADTFTPYVWLRMRNESVVTVSDNFFHLRPHEKKSVTVKHHSVSELLSQLLVGTFNEALGPSSNPQGADAIIGD